MDKTTLKQEMVGAQKLFDKIEKRAEKPLDYPKLGVEERNARRERYMNLPAEEKAKRAELMQQGRELRKTERHQVQKAVDILEILLQKTLNGGEPAKLEELKTLSDVAGANVTAMTAILLKQMEKAIKKGDTRSAEFILKASGDLKDKQEIEVKPVNPLANVSTDDLKMMLAATEEQQESQPPF